MAFDIHISPGGGVPIFKQIVDQVRVAAVTGRLTPGDQLPSVRALAEKLLINPNTVTKAYGELSREGVIDGQQGRGVFIATPRQIYTKAECQRRIAPLVDALVNEGLSLGLAPGDLLESLEQRLAKFRILEPLRRKTS